MREDGTESPRGQIWLPMETSKAIGMVSGPRFTRPRFHIIRGAHRGAHPLPTAPSAAFTLSGVRGRSRTRAPQAWYTALAMAGAVGTRANSPAPQAPKGPFLLGDST